MRDEDPGNRIFDRCFEGLGETTAAPRPGDGSFNNPPVLKLSKPGAGSDRVMIARFQGPPAARALRSLSPA
jgi:hypothetical protein